MICTAKISVNGRVTIPIEIRRRLGLKEGDKVVFVENGDNIILLNSNRFAFEEFQRDMTGEAEKAGLSSEQEVVDLVKRVREQIWDSRNVGNA